MGYDGKCSVLYMVLFSLLKIGEMLRKKNTCGATNCKHIKVESYPISKKKVCWVGKQPIFIQWQYRFHFQEKILCYINMLYTYNILEVIYKFYLKKNYYMIDHYNSQVVKLLLCKQRLVDESNELKICARNPI